MCFLVAEELKEVAPAQQSDETQESSYLPSEPTETPEKSKYQKSLVIPGFCCVLAEKSK